MQTVGSPALPLISHATHHARSTFLGSKIILMVNLIAKILQVESKKAASTIEE